MKHIACSLAFLAAASLVPSASAQTQTAILQPSDPKPGALFGFDLDLQGDSRTKRLLILGNDNTVSVGERRAGIHLRTSSPSRGACPARKIAYVSWFGRVAQRKCVPAFSVDKPSQLTRLKIAPGPPESV